MAITRTAWVDDDGSGNSGTVLNNAVKSELYDQIDAAIAGGSAWGFSTFVSALSDVTTGNVSTTQHGLQPKLGSRAVSTTSSATPTPNADTTELYSLTAQAAAAAFVTPTGTPYNGQKLIIRIKDDGTARALTWSSGYVAGGVALPSTTVISKILTIGLLYNTDNALGKWQCVAVSSEA